MMESKERRERKNNLVIKRLKGKKKKNLMRVPKNFCRKNSR